MVSSVKAEYPPVGNYHFNAYLSLIEKALRGKKAKDSLCKRNKKLTDEPRDAAQKETRSSAATPEPDEFEHIVPQQPRSSPSERYKNQGGFVMP